MIEKRNLVRLTYTNNIRVTTSFLIILLLLGTDLKLISGVEAIQREIYENGPVLAGFRFHSDFMFYKSGTLNFSAQH